MPKNTYMEKVIKSYIINLDMMHVFCHFGLFAT